MYLLPSCAKDHRKIINNIFEFMKNLLDLPQFLFKSILCCMSKMILSCRFDVTR